MEIAQVLSALRRRKLATILVIVVSAGAAVQAKRMVPVVPTGQATAQLLVDSTSGALPTRTGKEGPLAVRAYVLSQIMASDGLLDLIARDAGIPRSQITSEGPYNAPALALNAVTPSEARGPQLLSNFKYYRLTFLAPPGQPIVTVLAQGLNPDGAARLVDATAVATRQWFARVARERPGFVPAVTVRQLGPPQESAYSGGGAKLLMGVAGLGVLILGLLFVVAFDVLRGSKTPSRGRGRRRRSQTSGQPA